MRLFVTLCFTALLVAPAAADQVVRGHVKKDGTYVAPYVRSTPNSTQSDNYSTKGNYNPYTGPAGTKRDRSSESSIYNQRHNQ